MHHREKYPRRIYYQLGEVAKIIGRNVSTIKYWSDHFNIKPYRQGGNNRRTFTQDGIRKLLAIRYLLDIEMYTLKGAEVKFNLWLKGKYTIPEGHLAISEESASIITDDDFVLEYGE